MSTEAATAVVRAYEDAARRGDVGAYVALFDTDVFWGAADREPVRSIDDLRTAIAGMFGRVSLEPHFTIEHVDAAGGIAVAVVHEGGVMTPKGGEPRGMNLTEVFVLRERGDAWKISRLLWNSRGAGA